MDPAKAVPEKPRLAPGVSLAGQMQESAFEQPPWLIEREGQGYLQVPQPLYDVAERADGEHTLGDIAREVAEADGLRLGPDSVRRLIATQLIPNGVISASGGKVVAAPTQSRSALAIRRFKTIDAAGLEGVTRILQYAFWPPLMAVALGVAAVLMVWLYGVHGVGAALHDALYFPSFLLLLFVAVVLSAGFHELGHAAALRYGGGRPRSFGLGMYLMYPVFFTDVSDNYRLRRWARVRTDLAGFYFNLIFAFGVFVAYWFTRQEALLVIILAMNLDIIRQLMPFVRLDGYWTLADLTGVPDFLSKMGAFVKATVPFFGKRSPGRLAPLKWWARAVFLIYLLITIPAMLALLVMTVRNVPRVLATAWDALGQQGNALVSAERGANILGIAGSLGQSVLIIIPVAGLLYSLYRIGTSMAIYGWHWSEGSPVRRGAYGAASLAVAVLVYAMWMPQFPWPGRDPSPVYSPNVFQPIGADERLSLGDALSGVVVQRSAGAEALTVPAGGAVGGGPAAGSANASVANSAGASGGSTAVSAPGGASPRVSSSSAAPAAPASGAGLAGGSAPAAPSAPRVEATPAPAEAGPPSVGGVPGDAPAVVSNAPSALANAGATVVPEAVEAVPAADEAVQAVEAVPQAVEAVPQAVEAVPEAVDAVPQAVEAVPEAVEAVPEAVDAVPAVEAVPTSVSGVAGSVATSLPAAIATAVPPAQLAVVPTLPAVQATLPAVQPAVRANLPAAPAGDPPVPTVQPALTTALPALPTVQPALPTVQPALPTVQPALPAAVQTLTTVVPTLPAVAPTPAATLPAAAVPSLVATVVPTPRPLTVPQVP